jgi:hypothetical protein
VTVNFGSATLVFPPARYVCHYPDAKTVARTYWGAGQKVQKKSVVISAFTPEARLKRKIRAHLRKLGFVHAPDGSLSPQSSSKESIRTIHLEHRRDRLKSHKRFVQEVLPKLETCFANGSEIEPEKIQPRLELIEADTWQSELHPVLLTPA